MDNDPPDDPPSPPELAALTDDDWRDAYRQAWFAMLVVAILLAVLTIISAACFVFQTYFYLGGRFVADEGRVHVLGHLVRATVFGVLFVSLVQYLRSIDSKTGTRREGFALHHRTFWCAAAAGWCALASYGLFEMWVGPPRVDLPAVNLLPRHSSRPVSIDPRRIEFRRAFLDDGGGRVLMQRRDESLFVDPEAAIAGDDIESAKVQVVEFAPGRSDVSLQIKMTPEGARKMTTLTRSHMNEPLAVLIDGQLRAAPRVRVELSDQFQVGGAFTVEEVEEMQP